MTLQTLALGTTSLSISRIGLGGLPLGGHLGPVNRYEVIRTIQAALEGGITLFDTSPSYGAGMAEAILGEMLASDSDNVVVASKIGSGIDSSGQFWCLNNRPNVLRQVEGSLRRLRRDCIDIYVIPGDDPTTPISETLEAMEELRARGKIRLIGYCTAKVQCLSEAMKYGRIDVVQTPYNILNRSAEIVSFCSSRGIPFFGCEPYFRGLLPGMLHKNSSFDLDDLRIEDKRFRGERYRKNIENVNLLRAIAEMEGLSMAQLSLGWVLHNPNVTAAICGAKSRLQIRQSILASGTELKPDTILAIDQVVGEDVRQQNE